MIPTVLKNTQKVSFYNSASEASYVYVLKGTENYKKVQKGTERYKRYKKVQKVQKGTQRYTKDKGTQKVHKGKERYKLCYVIELLVPLIKYYIVWLFVR